jgi:membrane protease YdiL (CAAX protease family)
MTSAQQAHADDTRRGVLARPLEAIVFLLPLIIFYEAASLARPERVIAFDLMRRFFDLFGPAGTWAPGLGVLAILLATHMASGEKWSVRWGRVGLMHVEAVALAVPLLALNWTMLLAAEAHGLAGVDQASASLFDKLALGIGAGIYEEMVFRLVLISLIVMVGVDLLKLGTVPVAFAAVVLSSLVFAAHHHPPIGTEPFSLTPFLFRATAGVYLAIIFWYRGYGPAAGCHAAYNVALACLGADAG